MKKTFAISIAVSFAIQFAHAQSAVTPPRTPTAETIVGYQIGGQSANQRVWQKIVKVTGADGNFTFQTNRAYVELASGLNYQDPVTGQWLPSKEEIDSYPGGAIAQYGQYKVIFGNNLDTAGAIDLQMPDGQELKSHVLGMSYYDSAGGKSVLIAQIKDCQGQIAGSNQVLFADAFQGVSASAQYIYRRGSFEQNVILQAQPPSPESFGLSSTSCVLQVLTEFDSAPAPAITAITNDYAGALPDELLNFGTMYMTRGNAFLLGTNLPPAEVYKQWLDVNGRTVLVESVPLPEINASLSQLPAVAQTSLKPVAGSVQYVVSSQRLLPPPRTSNGTKTKMELAKTGGQAGGLVLDYITVTGNEPNYSFLGDSTYYVSGPVYLSGTAAFEGGAILKYTNNINPFLDLSACTQIKCLTAPYHPVVFTAKDDNSLGEPINGSIGYAAGYYANPAIRYFPYGYGSLSLTNFRIAYAYQAIAASAPNMTVSLQDGQIVVCGTGFYTPGQTSAYLENMLFADVGLPLELYLANVQAQNVTFTAGGYALVGPAGGGPNYNVTLNLVNCILANFYVFSTVPGITPTGHHNGFYPNYSPTFGSSPVICDSNPFQTAGGGNYYLNNVANGGARCQGAGSTAIDPALLTALKTKTTWPPNISYINHTISADNFTTLVSRDSASPPDLGWHYDPLDYVFQNSTVTPTLTTMTFPAGTAVGWQGQGLSFSGNGNCTVNFNGRALRNDYFVRCNTVQEADQSTDGTGIAGSVTGQLLAPTVNATFTRFSALGGFASFFGGDLVDANLSNCEFWNGMLGGSGTSTFGVWLLCANCLFDRSTLNFPVPDYSNNFQSQNCTLHGGSLTMVGNTAYTVHDSAFDGTAIQVNVSTVYNGASYNAYLNSAGANKIPNDSYDQSVSTFNWQAGPRGYFYLPPPPGSALINAGDQPAADVQVTVDGATSAQEPLSNFTTQTSQEVDSLMVDIGYHYTRTPSYLGPMDVVFIIDNTGSMSMYPILQAIKAAVDDAVDYIVSSSGNNYRLALVTPDNDQVNVRVNFSANNRNTFENAVNALPDLVGPGGGSTPESTDKCLETVVRALAASRAVNDYGCTRNPNESTTLQIGNFDPAFSNVLKFVVLLTDAPPSGFCDSSISPYDTSYEAKAHSYAQDAATSQIKINAILVKSSGDSFEAGARTVLQDYAQTTCGWYPPELNYNSSIFDVEYDILYMLYNTGECGQ